MQIVINTELTEISQLILKYNATEQAKAKLLVVSITLSKEKWDKGKSFPLHTFST